MNNAMAAAYITAFGPDEDIQFGRLPRPAPGPAEVLVRVDAVAVNHVDTFVRAGSYQTEITFPFVIGRDLVGTVAEAANGFAAGDRVWCNSLGHDGRQGSFAEYAAVPADRLYPLPGGVDPLAAVSVLHTGGTAFLGLFRHARVELGETVAIAGSSSGVGRAAGQLAEAAGARVLTVDHDTPLESIVDVYWDCAGPPDLERVVPRLARGGRLVLSAGLTARATLPIGPVYTRDISVHGFVISNASVADLRAAADTINRELATGRLSGRIWTKLALAEAANAHRMLETRERGGPSGRIVLVP